MRYYLAVVVEGEESVVVVFPVSVQLGLRYERARKSLVVKEQLANCVQNLLPNRGIVEEVWRGARECLYEPKG